MSEFANRVIVITGGETGIGRATVLQLARAGAQVVIGGILEDEGAATLKAVAEAGGRAEFHRADVRDSAQVDALVDGAVRDHGRIDGLICSAAMFDGFASGIDTTDVLWDQILDVNLRGTFFACRAALRHMVAGKAGRIVNVASVGGLVGMADGASYTASKHAVVGLTKHLGCFYAKDGVDGERRLSRRHRDQRARQFAAHARRGCTTDGRGRRRSRLGQAASCRCSARASRTRSPA
jgi:NAD(P)-dependent dehydrogenase (short-subunit alcohol dehydrogenase family)